MQEIEVDVCRMDTFVQQNNISRIDYLHCDAQGNDFKVLKSFGDKINIIKKGRCEASHKVTLYEGVDNSAKSIINFLKANSFNIYKITGEYGNIIDDLETSDEKEVDIYFEYLF